jgi:DNA-binding transcriptional regulator YhcF (GntR family)
VQITIDRSQATPVYVQIKAQIAYQIGLGILASGQRLPAIRQLAGNLGIAPLTVMQALGELEKDGLVESRPGVGTFVVDLHPDVLARSRRANLAEVVTRSIEDANRHGISERQFARALWDRVFPGVAAGRLARQALFVGNYVDDTPLLAAMVAESLSDYHLTVEPVLIQDLGERIAHTADPAVSVDVVIAVPLRFAEVRRIVGGTTAVFGLPLSLSHATREQLAHLPDAGTIGMVVTESAFKQSMRNVVAIYHPASVSAPVVSMDEQGKVLDLLHEVDVVIYSMGIRERIRPLLPSNALAIELSHVPDQHALDDLRRLLDGMGSADLNGDVAGALTELQPIG